MSSGVFILIYYQLFLLDTEHEFYEEFLRLFLRVLEELTNSFFLTQIISSMKSFSACSWEYWKNLPTLSSWHRSLVLWRVSLPVPESTGRTYQLFLLDTEHEFYEEFLCLFLRVLEELTNSFFLTQSMSSMKSFSACSWEYWKNLPTLSSWHRAWVLWRVSLPVPESTGRTYQLFLLDTEHEFYEEFLCLFLRVLEELTNSFFLTQSMSSMKSFSACSWEYWKNLPTLSSWHRAWVLWRVSLPVPESTGRTYQLFLLDTEHEFYEEFLCLFLRVLEELTNSFFLTQSMSSMKSFSACSWEYWKNLPTLSSWHRSLVLWRVSLPVPESTGRTYQLFLLDTEHEFYEEFLRLFLRVLEELTNSFFLTQSMSSMQSFSACSWEYWKNLPTLSSWHRAWVLWRVSLPVPERTGRTYQLFLLDTEHEFYEEFLRLFLRVLEELTNSFFLTQSMSSMKSFSACSWEYWKNLPTLSSWHRAWVLWKVSPPVPESTGRTYQLFLLDTEHEFYEEFLRLFLRVLEELTNSFFLTQSMSSMKSFSACSWEYWKNLPTLSSWHRAWVLWRVSPPVPESTGRTYQLFLLDTEHEFYEEFLRLFLRVLEELTNSFFLTQRMSSMKSFPACSCEYWKNLPTLSSWHRAWVLWRVSRPVPESTGRFSVLLVSTDPATVLALFWNYIMKSPNSQC